MLVKSKVSGLNLILPRLHQNEFFLEVLEPKRRSLFSGLTFIWFLLNHVKSLLAVIFNSEITVSILEA